MSGFIPHSDVAVYIPALLLLSGISQTTGDFVEKSVVLPQYKPIFCLFPGTVYIFLQLHVFEYYVNR